MLALVLFGSPLRQLESLVIPVAGIASAGLLFMLGRVLIGWGRDRDTGTPELQEDEIEHDPFERGSATEKRSSVRRGGTLVEVFVTDATAKMEPITGWVVDRSVGGLGLSLPKPFEVGTILNIRPEQGGTGVPWVKLEVKRCGKEGKSWRLGCQFVRTPPWSILLLFG